MMEASTVHRLLQYGGENGEFQVNAMNPLECDCLILDEVSMMDVTLTRSLLQALQPGTRLLLVGDADQLPSVGPGNVLADILGHPGIPQIRLKEIFRQAGDSIIVSNAHLINKGQDPELNGKGGDFFFEARQEAEDAAECIVQLCARRLPSYLGLEEGARDIQVISRPKTWICSTHPSRLNPPSPDRARRATARPFGKATR